MVIIWVADIFFNVKPSTTMKKLILLFVIALGVCSCGMTSPEPKLVSTATHNTFSVAQPVAAVFADLEVSPKKITFSYHPSKVVIKGGVDNVVNSAVREALWSNGNADVMVGLETQVKYNAEGEPEYVTITGYPAKYVNFRNPGDEYLRTIGASAAKESEVAPRGGLHLGK